MKTWLQTLGTYTEQAGRIILWMFLVLAMAVFLTHAAIALGYPYPLDYGEAPLLDQALRLARLENIYRRDLSIPPYTISNYPPLYLALLAPMVALIGPVFTMGRVLSLVATLASALFLGLLVHAHTRDRLAAWVAGGTFLAFPYVAQWAPLQRVDMLALALSTAALYVISRWHASRAGALVTAILLTAAVYTRQSYGLAAPLAAFVWLWVREGRRRALALAGMTLTLGLGVLAVLMLATQGGFFVHVVTANANAFDTGVLLDRAGELLETAPVLILTAGVILFFGLRRVPFAPLLMPYLAGATAAAATIGKIGSNVNYLIELAAALSLTGAAALVWRTPDEPDAAGPVAVQSRMRQHQDPPLQASGAGSAGAGAPTPASPERSWQPLIRTLVLLALAVQIGLLTRTTLQGPAEQLKWRVKARREVTRLTQIVASAEGPILVDEYMGLGLMQGQRLYLQPFERTQLAAAGHWDPTPLVHDIEAQAFPLILIHHFPHWSVYRTRWTPEMLDAIMGAYVATDFAADSVVLRPRAADAQVPSPDTACPGAPWAAPSRADFGLWWLTRELNFMGNGEQGEIPVYAVADGLLSRPEGWTDAVAIRHQDPLNPEDEVWTFYGGMADGWDGTSFVAADFPRGSEGVPVERGEILGYQGRYWDTGAAWVHVRFAVLPALEDGAFPGALVGYAAETDPPLPYEVAQEGLRDPSPYLGTVRSRAMGVLTWLPPRCQALP